MTEPSAAPHGIPPTSFPLTMMDVLHCAIRTLREQLRLFLTLGLAPMGIMVVATGIMVGLMLMTIRPWQTPTPAPNPVMLGILVVVIVVLYIPILLVFALFEAATCHAALQVRAGAAVTFREACGVAWKKAGRYLWLQLLRAIVITFPILIVGGVAAVAVGAGVYAMMRANSQAIFVLIPLLILFYIASLVWTVLAMIRLALAYPASIAEGLTAWSAIRRSLRLTRGAMGRIFVVALVIFAVNYAGTCVLEMAMMLIVALGLLAGLALHLGTPWAIGGGIIFGLVFLVAVFVWTMATYSALFISTVVLYRDQRLRLEGTAPAVAG